MNSVLYFTVRYNYVPYITLYSVHYNSVLCQYNFNFVPYKRQHGTLFQATLLVSSCLCSTFPLLQFSLTGACSSPAQARLSKYHGHPEQCNLWQFSGKSIQFLHFTSTLWVCGKIGRQRGSRTFIISYMYLLNTT